MKNITWQRGFVFVAASASHPSFHWQVMEVTEGLLMMQSCYSFVYLKTLSSSLCSFLSSFFIFILTVLRAIFALKFIDNFLTNVVELIYDGGIVFYPIGCLLNYHNLIIMCNGHFELELQLTT